MTTVYNPLKPKRISILDSSAADSPVKIKPTSKAIKDREVWFSHFSNR
jgi:hypothetical protein